MLIFRRIFLCVGRRRRLEDPKSFQHTSRGEQQVQGKNLELQRCFVFKFSSLEKSELKLENLSSNPSLSLDFKAMAKSAQNKIKKSRAWVDSKHGARPKLDFIFGRKKSRTLAWLQFLALALVWLQFLTLVLTLVQFQFLVLAHHQEKFNYSKKKKKELDYLFLLQFSFFWW